METNHCDEIEILISVMVFCYNKTVPHYKNYFTNFSLIVLSLNLILPEDYYEFLSKNNVSTRLLLAFLLYPIKR